MPVDGAGEAEQRAGVGAGASAGHGRAQATGAEALPPRTPPGGHSLHFTQARSIEARLHDPVRDFMAVAGSSGFRRAAAKRPHTTSSVDPALADETVRGILNFLVRSRYYEEAPDYAVNRATLKRPPPTKRQTMWGEETDEIPEMSTPPPLPTPQPSPTLAPPLSRPSTSTTGMATTGLAPTPLPFRALDWVPHRREHSVAGSSAASTRPNTRGANSAKASERGFAGESEDGDDFLDLDGAPRDTRANPHDEDEPDEGGTRRVQDSWRGQNYLFHVRHLCVQHVVTHIDWINAIPMLRFSDECNSPAIQQTAFEVILANFESILAGRINDVQLPVLILGR
jgi:hypothetical protein